MHPQPCLRHLPSHLLEVAAEVAAEVAEEEVAAG